MEEIKTHFQKVFIDESARHSKVAKRALDFFSPEKIEFVSRRPFAERDGQLSAQEFDESKKNLYITEFKGSFFKRCPGAKGVACCNYFVLNLGLQCNMNCSYCYLQSYINTPVMTVYSNIEQALFELGEIADQYPDLHYRVGTGETVDSLSLDELTLYSHDLISFFKKYPKWTLELKTKSNKVYQFLNQDHAGNVHISFSINPQHVVEKEEHNTASLNERLKAAEAAIQNGFKVTFNIDPMIYHPGWEKNYSKMVEEICRRFLPKDIPYITLGSPRFQPEQKNMMRERFTMKSYISQGEYFLSDGGKMRYDKDLRNIMFQKIVSCFRENDPAWRVSLCMETPESWVSTMASSPSRIRELKELYQPLPFKKSGAPEKHLL